MFIIRLKNENTLYMYVYIYFKQWTHSLIYSYTTLRLSEKKTLLIIFMNYFISAFFENLFEMRPDVCLDAAKQGLLQWLLRRLRAKLPFSENKLYSTEVLSILLQNTPENRQMLGDLEGIDILLQQLAVSTFK